METLFLVVIFILAVIYLYYRLIRKKGCGCGNKGCTQDKTDETIKKKRN